MEKFVYKTIQDFTQELASPAPVPGGGGASAMLGAVGIALADMVGELTVGKKRYADVEAQMQELMKEAQELRQQFLELIDEDAEVFSVLAAAYRIPKDAPERDAVMEEALRGGSMVPMKIMQTSARALELTAVFAEKGSRMAVSDAGCAAAACKAALQAASLNVFINTRSMKDREYAQRLEKQAEDLLQEYNTLADRIFDSVTAGLRGQQ